MVGKGCEGSIGPQAGCQPCGCQGEGELWLGCDLWTLGESRSRLLAPASPASGSQAVVFTQPQMNVSLLAGQKPLSPVPFLPGGTLFFQVGGAAQEGLF